MLSDLHLVYFDSGKLQKISKLTKQNQIGSPIIRFALDDIFFTGIENFPLLRTGFPVPSKALSLCIPLLRVALGPLQGEYYFKKTSFNLQAQIVLFLLRMSGDDSSSSYFKYCSIIVCFYIILMISRNSFIKFVTIRSFLLLTDFVF